MNKKLIALALVILAVLSVLTACTSTNSNETAPATTATEIDSTQAQVSFATVEVVPAAIINEDAQFKLIAEKLSTWKHADFDTSDTPEAFKYMVTDLNNNGRLEIFSAVCKDKHYSTSSAIYEVNEDCTDLTSLHVSSSHSEDSDPDYIVDSTDCYVNPETTELFYAYSNSHRFDGEEHLLQKGYFTLSDSYIAAKTLATKKLQSDGFIFDDFDDNVLTEEEFNNFTDTNFAGYGKCTATFGWTDFANADGTTAADLSTDQLVNSLKASFAEFSVK